MLPGEAAHVSFVAIDFALLPDDPQVKRDRLGVAMIQAGFRENTRTFFIWEGVTEYLSAEAVDLTLRFVRSL